MRAARHSFRTGKRHLTVLAALILVAVGSPPPAAAGVARIGTAARASVIRPLKLGDTGQRVKDAQWLLSGHNTFHARTYRGPIDGKFGAQTRDAALAIKYQLGYRSDQIKPVFGRDLRAILLGAKMPPLYYVRRASRHPYVVLTESYPLALHGPIVGWPCQGTHSCTQPPTNWQSDSALDIAVPKGTPVLATVSGKICGGFGYLGSDHGTSGRFAGLRFSICGKLTDWYFAHLSAFAKGLHVGAHVDAGQTLGYSGIAGIPHLHFACKGASTPDWRADNDRNGCDIKAFINRVSPPQLVPARPASLKHNPA